jgi:hypothetical protein
MSHRNIDKTFLFSGNATFTVSNPNGEHYTFRIRQPDENAPFFLNWLDNEARYSHLGILQREGGILLTRESKARRGDKVYKVAAWAIAITQHDKPLREGCTIKHAVKCGKCGRKLTTPESIERGIGPECIKHL